MAGFPGETGHHPRSPAHLTRAVFAPPAFSPCGHRGLARRGIAVCGCAILVDAKWRPPTGRASDHSLRKEARRYCGTLSTAMARNLAYLSPI
jgi:hypothetical protein